MKAGGNVLVQDVDYQLVLSHNVKEGRASVLVIGIGDYEGKLRTAFRIFGKPKVVGASKMPVYAKSRLIIENAKVKIVSGGTKVKLKGKKLTAVKRGVAKLAIYNKLGERVDTKEIMVYRAIAGVWRARRTSISISRMARCRMVQERCFRGNLRRTAS